MKHYEILAIIAGTISEDEIPARIDAVKNLIEKTGGTHITLEHKGKNRLAYPIKHIRYGYFLLGRFEAKPEVIEVVRGKIGLLDNMLRVIVRTFDAHKPPHEQIAFANMSIAASREREDGEEGSSVPMPAQSEKPRAPKAESKEKAETKSSDVNIADISKKLDAILEEDIVSV